VTWRRPAAPGRGFAAASPDVYRRRRIVALVLALAVLGGVGAGIVVVLAGSGGAGAPRLSGFEGGSGQAGSGGRTSPLRAFVHSLSPERQVAQLFIVGIEGQQPADPGVAGLAGRDWGGVMLNRINFADSTQLRSLAAGVVKATARAGHLPPLVAADQEGGDHSAFPDLPPKPQPEVSGGGRAQAVAQARAAARALRSHRVNMTLAPVADVGAAGGGVQARVYSDDTRAVTRLVSAAVAAYREGGVIAAVGHFPGEGTASQDPEQGTATVGLPLSDLRQRDLPPFSAVARAAPVVIMSNAVYAAYDGVTPAALLPNAVNGLLRGSLGFRGVVMTGDLVDTAGVMGQSIGQVAVSAVKAGDDLLYVSGGGAEQEAAYQAVLGSLRRGEIPRDRVEASVARVVALKQRQGLLTLPARKRG
jgi:beta-N-acetylhexosaminidase